MKTDNFQVSLLMGIIAKEENIKTVSFNLIGQNIKEIETEFYIVMHLKD